MLGQTNNFLSPCCWHVLRRSMVGDCGEAEVQILHVSHDLHIVLQIDVIACKTIKA
jgi:hypothetical protein